MRHRKKYRQYFTISEIFEYIAILFDQLKSYFIFSLWYENVGENETKKI